MKPLKRERVIRDMSQSELARRAGVARQVISNLERGASHGYPETWQKIAAVLGVSVDALLEEPDSPKAPAPQSWRERLRALDKETKLEFALAAKGLVSGPDVVWLGATGTKEILRLRKFMAEHGIREEDVLAALEEETPGLGETLDRSAEKFARELREDVAEKLAQRAHA